MRFRNPLIFTWLILILAACFASSPNTPSVPVPATLPSSTATANSTVSRSSEMFSRSDATEKGITFEKTFGGNRRDRGINLLQTMDGGYAIVGYSSSPDAVQEDVYLVRTDPRGKALWIKTYGGEGQDNGWAITEAVDGGFVIAGFTDSFGAGDMDFYLIRTDADGEKLWDKTYGGPKDEYGWAMAPTTDGGYVLAGQTESYGEGGKDGYLIKVNGEGEELWSQTFGGPQEDRLFSIDRSADSGFIMVGTTKGFGTADGNRDAYLVKTNDLGEVDWFQVFGDAHDDVGHSVRQTTDEGYIVTGYTKSFGAQNYDTWLIKTDEAGILQWQELYGGNGDNRTIYGEETEDGGYITVGYSRSFQSIGWDVFLAKSNSSGEVAWHKTFGGSAEDTGYTIRQTSDEGYILTGETYSFGEGAGDMYVIKVNQEGEIINQ